jgi:hypothetical protein
MSNHFMISYNSLVERTLTNDCFSLSSLSLDHKGIPLASASARKGESSLSGENSSAFFKNCENTMLVSITSSIYTRFLYTFSHMPFLTFLPSISASFSVNRLSAAIASNNSSSAAVFRIASLAIFDQLIEACLRIIIPRSSGICTVTSDIMLDTMNSMDLRITEASYGGNF